MQTISIVSCVRPAAGLLGVREEHCTRRQGLQTVPRSLGHTLQQIRLSFTVLLKLYCRQSCAAFNFFPCHRVTKAKAGWLSLQWNKYQLSWPLSKTRMREWERGDWPSTTTFHSTSRLKGVGNEETKTAERETKIAENYSTWQAFPDDSGKMTRAQLCLKGL